MSEPVKAIAAAPVRVSVTPVRTPSLARKCACAGGSGCKCDEEPAGGALQRKATGSAARAGGIPPIVRSVLSTAGRPLDSATRTLMESRFGHDFSGVRIHTGADATASAQAVGARAYTVGNDIVVAAGHDLHSPRGRHLLAHELTHTIQQRGLQRSSFDNLPISAPDHSCEREADAVADAVMAGHEVHAPAIAHHGLTMLARQVEETGTPDDPAAAERLKEYNIAAGQAPPGPDQERIRWFHVNVPFPVPAEKGPRALPIWKGRAADSPESGTALHMISTVTGHLQPVLKAKRSVTGTLREMWRLTVGWPADAAAATKLWNAAGGSATDFYARSLAPASPVEGKEVDEIPQPPTEKACQFDHVVELQAGGPDLPSNLAVISGTNNVRSAVKVTAEIRKRVEQISKIFTKLEQIGLIYSTVEQEPVSGCGTDCCCCIEENARKGAAPTGTAPGALAPVGENEMEYPLRAGNFSYTAIVPKDKKPPVALAESTTTPVNRFAARLVPGLVLTTLHRSGERHQIEATVDTTSNKLITLKGVTTAKLPVAADGTIQADKAKPQIGFTFPYLSEGTLTKFVVAEDGLHAMGTITPSFPLLKGTLLDFTITPASIAAALKPKTPLKSPIPGLELHEPQLLLPLYPVFKPEGTVGFSIGKTLVTGTLRAGADGTDFVAEGAVVARIPGLDEASGNVRYHRRDGWSSKIHLEKSGKAFVKRAAIDVSVTNDGLDAMGTLEVEPPGGSLVVLTISRNDKGELAYRGEGSVNVPGLADPVLLTLGYSAAGLTASGKAVFQIKSLGAKGNLGVSYDEKLGFIGTIYNFSFKRGLATVTLEKLTLANEKFTGKGEISMPVGKSLIARGAVTLDEKENLSITAALKIAKPVTLFDAIGGSYPLFRLPSIGIPIPGASIAGYGLELKIEGALDAAYAIGPGTLEDAEIAAGVNPLQATSAAGVTLKARLLIPASASITGSITGLIALDALIGEVAGGLTVSATAALKGGLDASTVVGYSPERLIVDAELNAALKLLLTLGLDAVVRASILTKKYETRWVLGRWPFDPGVSLTIGGAFNYKSDEPFKAPTLTFNKPALDGKKLVTGPFGGAAPKEKTA
jgi:hypothetical protein